MLNNNKFSLAQNVESVKMMAKVLEDKAKMAEPNIKYGSRDNPELIEEVSYLLVDSIKAKLSILNSVKLNDDLK